MGEETRGSADYQGSDVTSPDGCDWRYLLCPMPVLRSRYDDDSDEMVTYSDTCHEGLYVEYEGSEVLLAHGPTGAEQERWKVTCLNGHVLVVPDHEGNDHAVRLDWKQVEAHLIALAVKVKDV